MLTQSYSKQCHFSYESLKSLSKGNCVLMLFQMSFLRGFLQSHFTKQKAWSELLQVAFVIGACTRSPSEAGWWNETLNVEEDNTLKHSSNNLFSAIFHLWIHLYLYIWIFNYQQQALLWKGNYSPQPGLQHETDRCASPWYSIRESKQKGYNLNDTYYTIKGMFASQPLRLWSDLLRIQVSDHLQYTAFVSPFYIYSPKSIVGHSKPFHAHSFIFTLID